jgi:tetratricopeptide (TPR) repeat protein
MSGGLRRIWLAAALVAAVAAAYLPALRAGFVWDDDGYVTRPELQPVAGLRAIWLRPGATEQYYPVLHSAFWLEHRLWGGRPLGYHLAGVLAHAAAAIVFALVMEALLGAAYPAWLAAFLFALHPVAVESVAWIAEQKNTLSTLFYLLAALAYLRWEGAGRRRPGGYVRASLLFLLAILSKSAAATLPGALLVVLWWRRGALGWRRDVRPLLPWFALAAAAGLFTGWVERTYVGAQGPAFALSAAQRLLIAGRACWFYLGKLLWPAPLVFMYPRWTVVPTDPWQWLPVLGAAGALAALALGRRRGALACALCFLGSLFPTLGFLNVYAFLYSFVADHWQYLASLAVFAGAGALAAALPGRGPRLGLAAALALVLGALTYRQAGNYRDAETLYRSILARNPGAWMARANLGDLEMGRGALGEALADFREAAKLAPDQPLIPYDLGNALLRAGRPAEAAQAYAAAIRLRPDFPAAHANLAKVLFAAGAPAEAAVHYEAALRARPGEAEWELDLGLALGRTGRLDEALRHLRQSIALRPAWAPPRNDLANALARSGRWEEAIPQYEAALRLQPDYPEARLNLAHAHFDLGAALARAGRYAEAAAQFAAALEARPDYAAARFELEQLRAREARP